MDGQIKESLKTMQQQLTSWKDRVNNGRFKCQNGSSRPRTTTEWIDRETVRSVLSKQDALDSSLLTIWCMTHTLVFNIAINWWLKQPLCHLHFAPVHSQVQLQCCVVRPIWNYYIDWGRIAHSDESRFLLHHDKHWKRVW